MSKFWLKQAPFLFLIVASLSLFFGSVYQLAVTRIDDEKYPPPGYLIELDGRHLHFTLSGQRGPVVVLDAGLGCNSLDWALVEPEIAKFARVFAFDRPGYGWSDPGPEPRTSQQIVEELHELLHITELPGPYIFVGHSFGGLNAQLYASEYPEDVLGLVLVDAAHEKQLEQMPFLPYESLKTVMYLLSIFAPTGSHRLLIPAIFGGDLKKFPRELYSLREAKQKQVKAIRTAYAELRDFSQSLKQLREKNSFLKDIPIFVLTAGLVDPIIGFDPEKVNAFKEIWSKLQRNLAEQSSKGFQITAEKSGHMIHWEQPELIVEAVRAITEMKEEKVSCHDLPL